MSITLHCNISGSIVNGRAEREINRYKQHVIDVISDIAVTDIKNYLPTQYMYLGHHGGTPETNPVPANAGALAAAVHASRQSMNSSLVSDDPITYGAWIEGTDPANMIVWPHRKNPPPRRFPGYFTFRKISSMLQAGQAGVIAEQELPPYLTAMNI